MGRLSRSTTERKGKEDSLGVVESTLAVFLVMTPIRQQTEGLIKVYGREALVFGGDY